METPACWPVCRLSRSVPVQDGVFVMQLKITLSREGRIRSKKSSVQFVSLATFLGKNATWTKILKKSTCGILETLSNEVPMKI